MHITMLKQMGIAAEKPHRGPLLLANNRKLKLQFGQAQNRRLEKHCLV